MKVVHMHMGAVRDLHACMVGVNGSLPADEHGLQLQEM